MVLFLCIISILICGLLGFLVAGPSKKGLGVLLGALLGPLGILIAAIACRE